MRVASVGMTAAAHAIPFSGTLILTANVSPSRRRGRLIKGPASTSSVRTALTTARRLGRLLTFVGSTLGSGKGGIIYDIADFATHATSVLFTLSDGLQFTLNASLTVNRTAAAGGSLGQLSVGGAGTFIGDGFDNTAGTFTITTQGTTGRANPATGSGGALAVPEPASLALLCSGLVPLGPARRRRG